ncbi:MAG: GNAT family N-acetyltransferase, partial [Pseudomonadota bacterium]
MTQAFAIRPVTPADLAHLRAQLQALSDEDGGTYAVASQAALSQALFAPAPLIFALIADQGMAFYYPDFSTHRGEAGVYLQDIYVAPPARGTGLARAFLAAVMRHQSWGAQFMTLGVSPDNSAATRFYAKTGFAPRGYEMMILEGAAL